jgi:hypothetical protein
VLIFESTSRLHTTEFVGTCEEWDEASLADIPTYLVIVTTHEDGSLSWKWSLSV